MENVYFNPELLRFLLFQVHDLSELFKYDHYHDLDEDSVQILLDSVKSFADQELYPFFRQMDESPARFENGKILVHPQIGKIIRKGAELGLISSQFEYKYGGMQLPVLVHYALLHILDAANNNVSGYLGLTSGAANLITSFGSTKLIETFVPQMLQGNWMGTMALTEPQAGSSLSDITTTAYLQSDQSYKIVGQKIFISGGDHQFAENFVHLTLARISDAPAGTKGISLFVVPSRRMEADGTLVDNDVITAGEINKLGQRGYATTHLIFGEHSDCIGWLVGEPHKGLSYMFKMMNEARMSVGVSAASMATAAYYASLLYAGQRKQGRPIGAGGRKEIEQEPVLINKHADVRRMLLLQKVICEGSLSLVLECARLTDIHRVSGGEAKEEALLLLELLTPVVKTYPSEMGIISISNGLQILGGYGYTADFVLQQYYRDIRITSIYEGTTGIQSIDLLGRKIPWQGGAALALLRKEINSVVDIARQDMILSPYAEKMKDYVRLNDKILDHLSQFAKAGEYEKYLADASIFMEFFSTLIIGWQWLKMAVKARKNENQGHAPAVNFSLEILDGLRFYFKYEMPKMIAGAETLTNTDFITLDKVKPN
ncbi:MAG: acyl-CoA dehydrogenase [Saprospiraceae bacterium]|nr:acyl-CoA dehydrogenase [Saprospiraceae bacterium]